MRKLLLVALLLAACGPARVQTDAADAPGLRLRAFPPVGMAPQNVLLTAEITGAPNERYYCPNVHWIFPDETDHAEEGDCPPYEQRDEYPRIFTRGIRVGQTPSDGVTFRVALEKAGHLIATAQTQVIVANDNGNLIAARAVPVMETRWTR